MLKFKRRNLKFLSNWYSTSQNYKYIKWFKDIDRDETEVGPKVIMLSNLKRDLGTSINIPNGFAITSSALDKYLKLNCISLNMLNELKKEEHFQRFYQDIKESIDKSQFPADLEEEINDAYSKLESEYGESCPVAVRNSSLKGLENIDVTNIFEGFLNVSRANLIESCKSRILSWFHPNNLRKHIFKESNDSFEIAIAIQKMVQASSACSGLIYTVHIDSGFKGIMEIFSKFGFGGNTIIGDPDHYFIFKGGLKESYKPIISKNCGQKRSLIIFDKKTQSIKIKENHERKPYCLEDDEVVQLAKFGHQIEKYYGHPLVIEWAKDSKNELLYIIEARTFGDVPRLLNEKSITKYVMEELVDEAEPYLEGVGFHDRISFGPIRILKDISESEKMTKDSILVCDHVDSRWENLVQNSKGLITNKGGMYSQAYFMTQKYGKPFVVSPKATELLRDGDVMTIDSTSGKIYLGEGSYLVKREDLTVLPNIQTKLMHTIDDPDESIQSHFIPNNGVGLLKIEKVMNDIGIHPLSFLYMDKLEPSDRKILKDLTKDYQFKQDFFINTLAEEVAKVAVAYYPKQVIMRFPDYSSYEFKQLLGGEVFENINEKNPVLGWRGASRYIHPKSCEGFELECKAVYKVREVFGLKNLHVIIPFVRTPEEGRAVMQELEKNKLIRNDDFKVYMLCEVPTNVLNTIQFLEIFDGYSIGTTDLTQMILGVDKTNEIIMNIYDEKNSTVKNLISDVIQTCIKREKSISLCGSAASLYPDFVEFLVEQNIESISMEPSSVIHMTYLIAEKEKFINRIFSRKPDEFEDA